MKSHIKQVRAEEWNGKIKRLYIAILPILPDDFSEKYGVLFTDGIDDLDKFRFAVVRADDCLFWLESRPNGPEDARWVSVYVHGTESDLPTALGKFLKASDLLKTDLIDHVGEHG